MDAFGSGQGPVACHLKWNTGSALGTFSYGYISVEICNNSRYHLVYDSIVNLCVRN